MTVGPRPGHVSGEFELASEAAHPRSGVWGALRDGDDPGSCTHGTLGLDRRLTATGGRAADRKGTGSLAPTDTWSLIVSIRTEMQKRPRAERARFHRERIYATFTGLAVLTVLSFEAEHLTAWQAAGSLLVAIVAISLAGFVAELVAYQLAHSALPHLSELRTMTLVAGSAFASASIPFVMLAGAAIGILPLALALQVGIGIYFGTLLVTTLVAAARTHVPWRQQLISIAMLLGLGVIVIVMLVLAHIL